MIFSTLVKDNFGLIIKIVSTPKTRTTKNVSFGDIVHCMQFVNFRSGLKIGFTYGGQLSRFLYEKSRQYTSMKSNSEENIF